MQTPHEARMCPIDFEVQRSRSQCINYWKWFPVHNCFPLTPIIMKLHMQTPHEARMCPIDFEVQRSRSQCINYWKWFPAHNCFPLNTYHLWNFTCRLPMSQGCALKILRSKGQRSRSQCINYWKWFPAHNYFLSTPIMKLHMQTPHESRMCLEKLSPQGVFIQLGQPRSSFFFWGGSPIVFPIKRVNCIEFSNENALLSPAKCPPSTMI